MRLLSIWVLRMYPALTPPTPMTPAGGAPFELDQAQLWKRSSLE